MNNPPARVDNGPGLNYNASEKGGDSLVSRRQSARLLTLVLLLELALLCCACSQIACHHCGHGPRCSICEYVRLGLRTAFPLPRAILTRIALMLCAVMAAGRRAAVHAPTLFDKRVKLDD